MRALHEKVAAKIKCGMFGSPTTKTVKYIRTDKVEHLVWPGWLKPKNVPLNYVQGAFRTQTRPHWPPASVEFNVHKFDNARTGGTHWAFLMQFNLENNMSANELGRK